MGHDAKTFSLAELAEVTGVAPRTIRYYISRGLLAGPEQAGRGAHYTGAHLSRLQEILRLQKQGQSLSEITARVAGRGVQTAEPEAVWRYPVAAGVVVEVQAGLPPWTLRRVKRAMAEMASLLAEDQEPEE